MYFSQKFDTIHIWLLLFFLLYSLIIYIFCLFSLCNHLICSSASFTASLVALAGHGRRVGAVMGGKWTGKRCRDSSFQQFYGRSYFFFFHSRATHIHSSARIISPSMKASPVRLRCPLVWAFRARDQGRSR